MNNAYAQATSAGTVAWMDTGPRGRRSGPGAGSILSGTCLRSCTCPSVLWPRPLVHGHSRFLLCLCEVNQTQRSGGSTAWEPELHCGEQFFPEFHLDL